ncbi:hypothetical protein THAOC_23897, partial [Thalassiosira oceanica]
MIGLSVAQGGGGVAGGGGFSTGSVGASPSRSGSGRAGGARGSGSNTGRSPNRSGSKRKMTGGVATNMTPEQVANFGQMMAALTSQGGAGGMAGGAVDMTMTFNGPGVGNGNVNMNSNSSAGGNSNTNSGGAGGGANLNSASQRNAGGVAAAQQLSSAGDELVSGVPPPGPQRATLADERHRRLGVVVRVDPPRRRDAHRRARREQLRGSRGEDGGRRGDAPEREPRGVRGGHVRGPGGAP